MPPTPLHLVTTECHPPPEAEARLPLAELHVLGHRFLVHRREAEPAELDGPEAA